MKYDIIVVGGGHAGCEAAIAAAKNNKKTLLITGRIGNIANLPCNPSIGGSAKGIVVREIDALGGVMGKVADESQIQIKLLNFAKGPAVRALRAQVDKVTYPKKMIETLQKQENLDLKESLVEDLIIENNKVKGVVLEDSTKIEAKAVILTTGTYLKSDILIGDTRKRQGPNEEKPSNHLSDKLKDIGFKIIRLKTGTPPRIEKKSINFEKSRLENGDSVHRYFSFDIKNEYDINKQEPCYLIYTTEKTHEIINQNLNKSSMYGGLNDIESVGPRYCPSIEDKIVRFKDKERHQLFLEPESLIYEDIYIQGFSTSMPIDVQEKMVKSLPGLENAIINKYAYAIEYDAIYPTQLKQNLETKLIENLFAAGQINGTSGYEEAACQGLIAGINAVLKLDDKSPLVLRRDEAYIGVLIDDLVTKGVNDPYRLLTSRAEYRLLLRHDNADIRLRKYGYENNLISNNDYEKFENKMSDIEELIQKLKINKVKPINNDLLISLNTTPIKDGVTLYEFIKRPEVSISIIEHFIENKYSEEVLEQVELKIKYEGYINKAKQEADKLAAMELKKIPENINYNDIINLASEAKQKLSEIRPTSVGQAMRISGVNPVDISLLVVYLKKVGKYDGK